MLDMDLEHGLFEAYVTDECYHGLGKELDLERDPSDGGYLDAYVHGAWLAWVASAELRQD